MSNPPHQDPPTLEVLSTPVVGATARWSLRDAAFAMDGADVGALVVSDGEEIVGILTERDIVAALAGGADPDAVTVEAVMTRDPRYLTLADTAQTAARIMGAVGCRHLPVVDEGMAVGMVSLRDLLRDLLA